MTIAERHEALREATVAVHEATIAFKRAAAKATRPDCALASLRYEELEEAENVRYAIAHLEQVV